MTEKRIASCDGIERGWTLRVATVPDPGKMHTGHKKRAPLGMTEKRKSAQPGMAVPPRGRGDPPFANYAKGRPPDAGGNCGRNYLK